MGTATTVSDKMISHSTTALAENLPVYSIRCVNSVAAISSDWPVAHSARVTSAQPGMPACHIFQTSPFLEVWEKTYAPALNAQLCLIEVRTQTGAPVVFLPLTIIPQCGIKLLSFTDQGVADYNAPVLFPCHLPWNKVQANDLWRQIRQVLPAFDYADFTNMPRQIGSYINPLFLLANLDNNADSHATTLTSDWQSIEKSLRRPKNIRRNIRHLEELGELSFSVITTQEERQACLEFMLYEKQRRFVETKVPGFESYPEKLHYFQCATKLFHEAGALHLCALRLNGEIIACMWGLTNGTYYYGIMIASNLSSWARYSPGRIIHYFLIQHLKDQGYEYLDLGVGDEDWKLQNCNLRIPLKRMTVCVTPRGYCYERYQRLMTRLRATALWQAVRPVKWRIIRAFKNG